MTQAPGPYAATGFPPTNPDVGFGRAISLAFKNYANFGGISGRGEYWWFVLFAVLVSIGAGIVDGMAGGFGIVGLLWGLAILLPHLALAVRRLRDAGYNWAFLFLALVPFIGAIVLIVLLASSSKPQTR